MKNSISLLSGVLLSSALFWGVPTQGQVLHSGEMFRVPAENAAYCHMEFPAMREDSLSWARPVFNDGTVYAVDFYGACHHDPVGIDEIKPERRVIPRGIYGEGE